MPVPTLERHVCGSLVSGHCCAPAYVNTSHAERQNLTMRMRMRRVTRLANGFSKKVANHCHMVALYTVWYNFVKIHKTLKMAPAMATGVSDRTSLNRYFYCKAEDATGSVDRFLIALRQALRIGQPGTDA